MMIIGDMFSSIIIRIQVKMSMKKNPQKDQLCDSQQNLLQWINELLQLEITQLRQLATGQIYCHIINICHPLIINPNIIKQQPTHSHAYIYNLKLFQSALLKLNLNKPINIERLSQNKQEDHLNLARWLKAYYIGHKVNKKSQDCSLLLQVSKSTECSLNCQVVQTKEGRWIRRQKGENMNSKGNCIERLKMLLFQGQTKLQMLQQVIICSECPQTKVLLIQQILNLKY